MPRRFQVATLMWVALLASAGCGSGAVAPTVDSGCDKWCGNGRATVSFHGLSTAIAGGGCYDAGSAGIDARFGDWQGVSGVSDFLQLTLYPSSPASGASAQGATALPGGPSAGPDYPPVVTGSVAGQPFVLGPDTVVTWSPDGTGSFSGTDVNGGGPASGTYTCR